MHYLRPQNNTLQKKKLVLRQLRDWSDVTGLITGKARIGL